MKQVVFLCMAAAFALTGGPASSQSLPVAPQDSVLGDRWRGRGRAELPRGGVNLGTVLLRDTLLGSQFDSRYYIRYGPFLNQSGGTLHISLRHAGSARRHGLAGVVDNRQVAAHERYLEFSVPPGSTFHFRAMDQAAVRVDADRPGVSLDAAGLPTGEQFRHPTGQFLECLDFYWPETDSRPEHYAYTRYLYAAATMTDKSFHEIRPNSSPEITLSRAPSVPPPPCRRATHLEESMYPPGLGP